ncbi:ABC transporter permease [Ciceribacter sp. RN22]|uniref:ABC transporter permease n=1 Tax=Ciceribacter sp. RN22 TaxID=2954932 RepID=UPI0020938B70|nr:ABC transporter permease [Ciceribacter sp. RN22]MCO6180415.1 ABC transporter permease [Ciceribacter sp. RN22]
MTYPGESEAAMAAEPATRRLPGRGAGVIAGGAVTSTLVAVALISLVWTPLPSGKMQIAHKLQPPLSYGLLGTDQYGRDVLSMLMAGAWNSLSIAAAAVALGASIGTVIGMFAAARRGLPEAFIMRAADVIFAVPPILSAMMLGAFLGAGRTTAVIAIAVFMVPVFARVAAGATRQIWSRNYVLAARGAGKGDLRITIEHVFPNIASQIIVHATIQLGLAILTEAGLSFLGLGTPPPAPTWGRMLADAQTYLETAPWLAILPGSAIAAAVLGFNMLGDGLRDLFDPRTEGRP